jgi:hypothetical protein
VRADHMHAPDAIAQYEWEQSGQRGEDSVALQYLHTWTVVGAGKAELRSALVA